MNILAIFAHPLTATAFILSVVLAITVHEFAHAWTAYRLGDDTPYLMGRVSLNPLAHMDPVGSLAFLLIGFGWGKPVQINPMRLTRQVDELLVALAGPFSNILLALAINLFAYLLHATGSQLIAGDILSIAAQVSIVLAAFNILPIPPLDGSSIVAYFYPPYRSIIGSQLGFFAVLILIFLGGNALITILQPIINLFTQISTLYGLIPLF